MAAHASPPRPSSDTEEEEEERDGGADAFSALGQFLDMFDTRLCALEKVLEARREMEAQIDKRFQDLDSKLERLAKHCTTRLENLETSPSNTVYPFRPNNFNIDAYQQYIATHSCPVSVDLGQDRADFGQDRVVKDNFGNELYEVKDNKITIKFTLSNLAPTPSPPAPL
jgi:hypothetical protein